MSVRAAERNQGKLELQLKAENLIVHTIRIASNPKVFDPTYSALTDKVIGCAVGIGQDLWEANGIRVRSGDGSKETRHMLQNRAIRQLDVLLYLMTLCRRMFHLRTKKYEYWVRLARETRALARKWRDSDVKRYRDV